MTKQIVLLLGLILWLVKPGQGLAQSPASSTAFVWAGAVTPTSAVVKARLLNDSPAVRLVVSSQADLSQLQFSDYHAATQALNNRLVAIQATGLAPNTQYYYALEIEGRLDLDHRGQFKTFPEGPASFTFAFGSCAETGSSHPVFETIRSLHPLFFLHLGDLHYRDIGADDPNRFRAAYDTVLASATQAALYQDVPLVYMWDDHDYGPNDSAAAAPGRRAARLTYQEYVPHYPLPAGSGDVPLYQAFTVGRARVILTDLRSEKSPDPPSPGCDPNNPNKTLLGEAQKSWLKQELLSARDRYPLVVWASTSAWFPELSDGWRCYAVERREIADFIKQNQITNLVMLSGDLHITGIDDGAHTDFSNRGGGFPEMVSSPLDRPGFVDGLPFAPYNQGAIAERNLFGLMTVIDNGGQTVTVQWSARNAANEELLSYQFAIGARPAPKRAVDRLGRHPRLNCLINASC